MNKIWRRFNIVFSAAIILHMVAALHIHAANPKSEFRGAWLHTVFQEQYLKNSSEQNKTYICSLLDKLKEAGINAVIFQVRPQADAFYVSQYEPWSIFLTSEGKAPVPFWDPLKYIIEQAHIRGMELHAWLNPYRVTSSAKQIPKNSVYTRYPERFVKYGGKIYFDPGLPENRDFIANVVADIVEHYDIDAIHMDDYFYPYPVKNIPFPDDKSYKLYGKGMDRNDWRRENVNLLIEKLSQTIKDIKPWVRFGVSPFGIWRNKKSDERGSETDGLENYDSLYADVLLWTEKGWLDYLMPQLYWNIEHPVASYKTLAHWWNQYSHGRHMIIGQDIAVTFKAPDPTGESDDQSQLKAKINMSRELKNISGNCWWPGYSLVNNHCGVSDSLAVKHYINPALPPSYTWISKKCPESITQITLDGKTINWEHHSDSEELNNAARFVVYRFESDENLDYEDSDNICAITGLKSYKADRPGFYSITVLNRVNNESLPSDLIKIEE